MSNNKVYKKERHGERYTKLWKEWNTMRWRCNPKNKRHHVWYSGKGIQVCEEWDLYTNFRNWALLNGFQEHLTIDRINHNKNYCPENCRWITQEENIANTRLIPVIQYDRNNNLIEKYPSRAEASRKTNIPCSIIDRILKGNIKDYDKFIFVKVDNHD